MNEFDRAPEGAMRRELVTTQDLSAYQLARDRKVPKQEAALLVQPIVQGHDAVGLREKVIAPYWRNDVVGVINRFIHGVDLSYTTVLAYAGAVNNLTAPERILSTFEDNRRNFKERHWDQNFVAELTALELSGYPRDTIYTQLDTLNTDNWIKKTSPEAHLPLLSASLMSSPTEAMNRLQELRAARKFSDDQTPGILTLASILSGEAVTELLRQYQALDIEKVAKDAKLNKLTSQGKALMVLVGCLGRFTLEDIAREYSRLQADKSTKDAAVMLMLASAAEKSKAAVTSRETWYWHTVGKVSYTEGRVAMTVLKKPGSY